jgi:hypothetical protein
MDYWCEDDENGYYFVETSLGYGLYRQNKTNPEKTLIRSEKFIRSLNLYGDWLYYIAADQNICRIKKDAEEYSVVLNYKPFQEYEDAPMRSFCIVDDVLFFQMNFGFYQYDMSKKTIELIDGDVKIYHIANNQLYFIGHARKDFTIYIMNLETEETEILLGDGIYGRDKEYPELYYSNFIFIGDVMYYTKRNTRENDFYLVELYRYENGESTLIDDELNIDEYSLFEHDGKLYYIVRGEETNKLMQYNPKDENITEILMCKNFSSRGKIVDGYFYYLDSDGEIQQVRI